MKQTFKTLTLVLLALGTLCLGMTSAQAADKKVKLKVKPYPMDTCIVSGEKLGSMGDPVVFAEGDQEIAICCAGCKKDFLKDKKASLAKIDAAAKKVKPYPLTTCIVSGEKLEDDQAVGAVADGREYMFCCKSCLKDFKKDTAKFSKKLDEETKK
jgi:YHS domain-containing protein